MNFLPSGEPARTGAAPGMRGTDAGDPALIHLAHLAATGVAVPAALRAAASEAARGPGRRWLMEVAERLERGETTAAIRGDGSALVAAVAAGPGGVVGSLADYFAVHQTLGAMRRRILAALLGGALLIAISAVLGLVMLSMLSGAMFDLIAEFEIEQPLELVVLTRAAWMGLPSLVVLSCSVALVVWLRRFPSVGSVAERVCDFIPLAGRALAAIDLAEMSDALSRLLAAGHPYPAAFDGAAGAVSSIRLRRWLWQASAALQQGASVDVVMQRLPLSAGVLPALVGSLGPAPEQPDQAWQIAARSVYEIADRRSDRAARLLPPVAVVCAATTAWLGLSVLILGFNSMFQMITSLG